jgi:subtilisin family serine protease
LGGRGYTHNTTGEKSVRRIFTALAVLACALLAWAATANAQGKAGDAIPGSYIVVTKDGSDPKAVANAQDAKTEHVYRQALKGFSAKLTDAQVAKLRRSKKVAYVEQDRVYTASTTQTGATWGLDRIDQRNLPLSGTYTYTRNGSGVTAYVIDTGIATAHSQFGGRATNVYDAFGGNGQDCNGHGTHVAGTIGSTTYGVAKGVSLRGVRVLNCSGSGATSGIIAAINWLAANHAATSVANMSLGGGYSSALNSATTNLANSGVFVAVAAGNESQNACNVSPASAPGTYTSAASDRSDTRASFSNYGGCVDGYAPGVSITSTWRNGGTNTISGTSMASPHTAGVGALYKSTFGNAAWSTIRDWINANATAGVIRSNVSGTPNRLLYKSSL